MCSIYLQFNSSLSLDKDKKITSRRRVPSPGEPRRGSLVSQAKSGMQAGGKIFSNLC